MMCCQGTRHMFVAVQFLYLAAMELHLYMRTELYHLGDLMMRINDQLRGSEISDDDETVTQKKARLNQYGCYPVQEKVRIGMQEGHPGEESIGDFRRYYITTPKTKTAEKNINHVANVIQASETPELAKRNDTVQTKCDLDKNVSSSQIGVKEKSVTGRMKPSA